MRATGLFAAVLLVASAAAQDEPPLPPPNRTPVLVLDQGGRAAPVAAVAFSPDSATLYVGGADKQVWTYTLRGDKYMPAGVIRVPIGPGNAGDVNAIAVAPDNKWVAVAGRAPMRDEAWFGQDGVVTLSKHLPPLMRKDLGVVYLFDPANPNGKNAQVLRGPVGEVRALAFATPTPPGGPVLVTASVEPDEQGQTVGVVRVWDVTAGKELARRADFPPTRTLPGLAAWPSGKGGHAVKVALAWEQPDKAGGELRVWDTGTDEVKRFADGSFNSFLAVRPGPDGAPKELLSGGFVNHIPVTGQPQFGQVVARPADGGDPTRDPHRFPSEGGFHYLPRGVAAAGDATVAVVEIDPKPVNSGTGRPAELRFIDAQGKRRPPVPLRGVSARVFPAVVGSPDGKWVAVSGFADHRVEVYAAAALGAGRAEPQVLPGMTDGFTQVKFLAGDKLWVGGPGDGPTKGGVVFDFPARQAKGNDGRGVLDNPPDTSKAVPQRGPDGVVRVAVTAGGRTATYSLRGTEVPTQVAYLPAGAAWR
jgi:WD40 repeat protein